MKYAKYTINIVFHKMYILTLKIKESSSPPVAMLPKHFFKFEKGYLRNHSNTTSVQCSLVFLILRIEGECILVAWNELVCIASFVSFKLANMTECLNGNFSPSNQIVKEIDEIKWNSLSEHMSLLLFVSIHVFQYKYLFGCQFARMHSLQVSRSLLWIFLNYFFVHC